MNIMITVQPWADRGKIYSQINLLEKLEIKDLRINLKPCSEIKHFEELFYYIDQFINIYDGFKLYFDIGVPFDTLRIKVNNNSYSYHVKSGEVIRLSLETENFKDKMAICLRRSCENLNIINSFYMGEKILYGDGENEFEVVDVGQGYVDIKAKKNGMIWDGKALIASKGNLIKYHSLENLLKYINKIPKKNVEALICSFIETETQIREIRRDTSIKVISKIETVKGMQNIERIAECSDGVMLGRGDLLLDAREYIRYYELQEKFLKFIAENNYKNSIIATDIFESMEKRSIASRSDITDLMHIMASNPEIICLSSGILYSDNLEICINQILEMYSKL